MTGKRVIGLIRKYEYILEEYHGTIMANLNVARNLIPKSSYPKVYNSLVTASSRLEEHARRCTNFAAELKALNVELSPQRNQNNQCD